MSDDEILEDAEIDFDPAPGHQPKNLPVAPSKDTALPDNLTVPWISSQASAVEWKNARLTPHLIKKMAEEIRRGLSPSAVAARNGFKVETWYAWNGRARKGQEPYLTWYRCMGAASAQLEEELVMNVRGAAATDWKAASWLLGKMNREVYGDNKGANVTNVNIESTVTENTQTINSLNDDDAMRIATIMGKIGALPPVTIEGEVVSEDDD